MRFITNYIALVIYGYYTQSVNTSCWEISPKQKKKNLLPYKNHSKFCLPKQTL